MSIKTITETCIWGQARGEATIQPVWDNLEEH